MPWEPLTQTNFLTFMAGAHERTTLDFKLKYDISDPNAKARTKFELAKDVAAFANLLGGTILIGAKEGGGERKGRPIAFADQPTGDLVKILDDATNLCRPLPISEPAEIEATAEGQATLLGRTADGPVRLLAINIPPMLSTPVGVSACDANGMKIEHAYRFPVRTVEGTRFLRPEELAFHINSRERTMLLQLQAVPAAAAGKVVVWSVKMAGGLKPFQRCRLEKINAEELTITLGFSDLRHSGRVDYTAEVPLAFVRAVWRAAGDWVIAIDGAVFDLEHDGRTGFIPAGGMYGGR